MFGFFSKSSEPRDQRLLARLEGLRASNAHQELIPIYDKMLQDNPESAPTWMERGQSLVKLGRLSEAAESFGNAGRLGGPGTERAFLQQVDCLRQAGDPTASIAAIKNALNQRLAGVEIRHELNTRLALLQTLLGQSRNALDTLAGLREEMGTQTPPVHSLYRVEALLADGKADEADRLLKTCLRMPGAPFVALTEILQKLIKMGARAGTQTLVEQAESIQAGQLSLEALSFHYDPVVLHVTKHFGAPTSVLPLAKDEVRLLVVEPGSGQSLRRLVTLGLSSRTDQASELMMTLEASDAPDWAIQAFQELCQQRLPLYPGQSLKAPEGTGYAGFLVMPSMTASKSFQKLKAEKEVTFLALYPLYTEEFELLKASGPEALLPHLEKHNLTDLVKKSRPNMFAPT